MKQLYFWLRDSQRGPLKGSFRWHDRNGTTNLELNPGCLSSGFDDCINDAFCIPGNTFLDPRATHPTDQEYHLDLRCWMAMSSSVLTILAQMAGDSAFVPVIQKEADMLNDLGLLDRLHWSEDAHQYCDYGLHRHALLKLLKPVKTHNLVKK